MYTTVATPHGTPALRQAPGFTCTAPSTLGSFLPKVTLEATGRAGTPALMGLTPHPALCLLFPHVWWTGPSEPGRAQVLSASCVPRPHGKNVCLHGKHTQAWRAWPYPIPPTRDPSSRRRCHPSWESSPNRESQACSLPGHRLPRKGEGTQLRDVHRLSQTFGLVTPS